MNPPFFCESLRPLYREHPLLLVDVGARLGLNPPWKEIEPHLRVVGFEPDARSFDGLKDGELPARINLNVGLYREKARKALYQTRTPGGSSILEPNRDLLREFPNPERYDVVDKSEIELDTLDRQLAAHALDDVDFIKIDTQGSELFVLEGASRTLGESVLGVEVEVEFLQLYREAALFPEVHSFMLDHGFQLVDLRPIYWKRSVGKHLGHGKGQLAWGDALYFKDAAKLPEILARRDARKAKAKCIKAMAVCAAYGYFDYSLALLDATNERFTPSEVDDLRQAIQARGRRTFLPEFPGRLRLERWLDRLQSLLGTRRGSWVTTGSGRHLGNLE